MPPPQVSIPETASDGRQRFRAAREVLDRAVAERAFPGAAWGVLLDGEVVVLDAVGRFTSIFMTIRRARRSRCKKRT